MTKTVSSIVKLEFGIDAAKLTQYLLNLGHLEGGSKARFFIGHGFRSEDPDQFAVALLQHSLHELRRVPTPHGLRVICEGPLPTPNGTVPQIRSVWQINAAGKALLVKAHPL